MLAKARFALILAASIIAFAFPASSKAALIRYDFQAAVIGPAFVPPAGGFGSSLTLGSQVSGHFAYDQNAVDPDPSTPGSYHLLAPCDVSVTNGTETFATADNPQFFMSVDPLQGAFEFSTSTTSGALGVQDFSFFLVLSAPSGTSPALPDYLPPGANLTLADLPSYVLSLTFSTGYVHLGFTSFVGHVVPEPPVAVGSWSALACLILLRFRGPLGREGR